MQHLSKMHMPVLQRLSLAHAVFNGEGAYWLAQGCWSLLDLLNNEVDARGMQHVGIAVWPQVQHISVAGNLFADDGLQAVDTGKSACSRTLDYKTQGNWPVLEQLTISLRMFTSPDTIVHLGRDIGKVQDLTSRAFRGEVTSYRSTHVLRAAMGMWPQHLSKVQIVA